jgi:hypothetical protein
MVEEFRPCGLWRPRAIRYALKDADARIRQLQAKEPQKRFRIITVSP